MFLVPVFGLVLGFVVLDERPGGWTLAGIVLVLLSMGVALIRWPARDAPEQFTTVPDPTAPPGSAGPATADQRQDRTRCCGRARPNGTNSRPG